MSDLMNILAFLSPVFLAGGIVAFSLIRALVWASRFRKMWRYGCEYRGLSTWDGYFDEIRFPDEDEWRCRTEAWMRYKRLTEMKALNLPNTERELQPVDWR